MDQSFQSLFDQLHSDAIEQTGFNDFGSTEYITSLKILLDAYDRTSQFNEIGKQITYGTILNCLKGRLYLQASIKNIPKINQYIISKPIFIIGLPRSGTTFLHRLLCYHAENQGIENWLGTFPEPRPSRQQWGKNPRYLEVEAALTAYHEMNPEIKNIHEMAADKVDECRLILMHCFENVTFQSNATIPDYQDWLYTVNFTSTYEYFYRSLQIIGFNDQDKRWVLKDPSHMWSIDYLFKQFPDATVIQIHRDPLEVIPSVCSLVMSAKSMSEPSTSPKQLGEEQLEQWANVLEKTIEFRKQFSSNFIDIFYNEILDDPIGVLQKIYSHLGESINHHALDEVINFSQDRSNKNSKHQYSLGEYGLTDVNINERFSEYKKHYDL